jgi:glycosyltransferase involved in cell wall biosynthesis
VGRRPRLNDHGRLRLAHVSATFPPYYGGTGNVCYHNARVLAERGHEVHVYTSAWHGEPDDPIGVTVHRLQPRPRIGNAALLPRLIFELRRYDVVHLHLPFIGSGELTAALARLRGIPLVVTYHNDLDAPGVRGFLFVLYRHSVAPAILFSARRVGVVSAGYAEASPLLGDLARSRSARLLELPNGVDLDRFHPGIDGSGVRRDLAIPDDAFVVAFSGVLDAAHHFKRLDLLLEALRDVQTDRVWLLVIGGGDLLPRYERLAAELGVGDRVRFVGQVAHDQVPNFVAAADVLALPSDAVESFGMVLIEAMACGRPVIATDLPGVRDVVSNERDGRVVPPGNVAALTRAIHDYAAMTPAMRREQGEAGRRKVEIRYAWSGIGEHLERLYASVLNEDGALH